MMFYNVHINPPPFQNFQQIVSKYFMRGSYAFVRKFSQLLLILNFDQTLLYF